MMNDDEVFPDPREFSPERFLQTDANGRLKYVANEVDPRTVIFGYGRRSGSPANLLMSTEQKALQSLSRSRARFAFDVEHDLLDFAPVQHHIEGTKSANPAEA
jgi:hypothetical protein